MVKKIDMRRLPFKTFTPPFKMSSAFVHSPSVSNSPEIGVEEWLASNWDKASFTDATPIWLAGGVLCPLSNAALRFRNFRQVTGQSSAYFADPCDVVGYRQEMKKVITEHKAEVLVPLGLPTRWDLQTQIVLQQSARQWVSGGANRSNMCDDNVVVMYYGALQSLVFALGQATSVEAMTTHFTALVALTRAFAKLHAHVPAFQKVTTAMVVTPGVDDMLQKALAHVFCPHAKWDKETKLDMLDIVVRRNLRHGTSVVGTAPGPLVVFVLAPLLRQVAWPPKGATSPSAESLMAAFNAQAAALLRACVSKATSDTTAFAVATLSELTEIAGCRLSPHEASEYLSFAKSTPQMSKAAPWAAIGVLPHPEPLMCAVHTEDICVSGARTHEVRIVPQSSRSFKAVSFKGVAWAGFNLNSPGIYTFRAHDLGIAARGEGSTRGEELIANLRITMGKDILPAERRGYSSAGMEHVRLPSFRTNPYRREGMFGQWKYVQKTPLNLDMPFTVTLTGKGLELAQADKVLFSMENTYSADDLRDMALIGFKNLWLEVSHTDLPPPPPPKTVTAGLSYASAAKAAPAPAPTRSDLDLPPTALLAQLHAMASRA